jgi:hypothetical protein
MVYAKFGGAMTSSCTSVGEAGGSWLYHVEVMNGSISSRIIVDGDQGSDEFC